MISKLYYAESPELRKQEYITKEEFELHLRRSGNYCPDDDREIPITNISKPSFKPTLGNWTTANELYYLPSYVDELHTKPTKKFMPYCKY